MIPAFVNPLSGGAEEALEKLRRRTEFEVREVEPQDLAAVVATEARNGTRRVLVAGGDGSIATAAQSLCSSTMELAILPGGTLNHFARDAGIPVDSKEAIEVAVNGRVTRADVATLNDRLFLNTSSVGAYVQFVRVREYFERWLGYRLASAVAAVRILGLMHEIVVELDVEGVKRTYRTPLVFIGVGERELRAPVLGDRVPNGKRGLHVMIISGRSRARMFALALSAVARGVKTAARRPDLDSFIVERCTLRRNAQTHVAVDGEIVSMNGVLEYAYRRDAVNVVVP